MEDLPQIVFQRIMKFATERNRLLKQVVRWEKVNRKLAERLMEDFWQNVTHIYVRIYGLYFHPYPMRIQLEDYSFIDVIALKGFKQRGVRSSKIAIYENAPSNLVLPEDLADSVPTPVTYIQLGNRHNMNDPEIMKLLQNNSGNIDIVHMFTTNKTASDLFVNALLNLRSLKLLSLSSVYALFNSIKFRESLYTKLQMLSIECLMVISKELFPYMCIVGNDLFTLLEKQSIKCLHLRASNHYIERWLADKSLHNRAQITNLCISNSQVSYNESEKENRNAPLYHTFADYKALFPRLQYLCVGISLARFDDDRLDSMLSCYYLQNSFNIQVCLTVRLFHQSPEIQMKRFDWIFSKLRMVRAEVDFVFGKTEGRIKIKSKGGNIFTEIFLRFYEKDASLLSLEERRAILVPQLQSCIDLDHYNDYWNSSTCLCASNPR